MYFEHLIQLTLRNICRNVIGDLTSLKLRNPKLLRCDFAPQEGAGVVIGRMLNDQKAEVGKDYYRFLCLALSVVCTGNSVFISNSLFR